MGSYIFSIINNNVPEWEGIYFVEVSLFMLSVANRTFLGVGFGGTFYFVSPWKIKYLLSLNCPKCRSQQFQKLYLILVVQRWKTFISLQNKAYFTRYKYVYNIIILTETTLASLSITVLFGSSFPLFYD